MATESLDTAAADGTPRGGTGRLAGGKLGTAQIVFFVIAAASPLTIVLSTGPLSLRVGGLGAPGVMLATGVVLLLFAAGFTAMSKHVTEAGAFYAYVTRGLGPTAGAGAAMMTMAAYGVCVVGFVGYIGVFGQGSLAAVFSIDVPWQICSLVAAVIVAIVGYCQVDVGAKVLMVLVTLEVAVILVLIVAVLVQGGPESPSVAPLSPDNVFFSSGTGTLFLLAFGAYIGVEGTAIYSEEAASPDRTIPRATYIAVGFLAVFYAVSFWVVIYGFGTRGALAEAQGDGFLDMVFAQADSYVGGALVTAFRLLIVTSFLATIIAFHNACTRYMFSLGRSGLLPETLARTHPRMESPHHASAVLSIITFAAVGLAMAVGLDPFLELGTWLYASGVIGVVAAQALCSISVVMFFRADRRGHGAVRVIVAPLLGFIGLAVALYLMANNFSLLSGYTDFLPNAIMIGAMPAVFVLGVVLHRLRLGRSVPRQHARVG